MVVFLRAPAAAQPRGGRRGSGAGAGGREGPPSLGSWSPSPQTPQPQVCGLGAPGKDAGFTRLPSSFLGRQRGASLAVLARLLVLEPQSFSSIFFFFASVENHPTAQQPKLKQLSLS